jgi:hypothetical protein
MEYSEFLKVLLQYKKIQEDLSELYDMGFDFFEGKYKLISQIENIVDATFDSHYTKEGKEWIDWFIYEADWGTNNFSEVPTYKKNEDGTLELIPPSDRPKWGANDENGNPICHSFESLYEYVQQYKK